MSIHVALNHVTHYRYDRPVQLGPQVVRLRPAPHARTPVQAYSLSIVPQKHFVNWQQDPQGNWLARLVFPERTRELRIEVDLVAEMAIINPFDFFLEPDAERYPFRYNAELERELAPYLARLPLTPLFKAYLDEVPRQPTPTADFLVELNRELSRDVRYVIRMAPGVQTPEETLEAARGSCRDSGWLLVQLLRHLGIAARFVSGYLIQLTPDVKPLEGPAGPASDFTDLHAWCEAYLPGAGWVGLDPTSGLLAGEGHVPLACSPDPGSASPISGLVEECEVDFSHQMRIERVREAPRVTKPYTEAQWAAIDALGRQVDASLAAQDVRLTMGGEPTFVSIDERDGAEWNTEALGPQKRTLGAKLLRRLKARYASGGLLHYGQGKRYPGEQLPRWSLSCFWRKDGEPLWEDASLFADEGRDYGATEAKAAAFLRAVAQRLGLDARHMFPAREDAWYYLWRERRLPANVDPFDSRLDDPLERERLRRVYMQGLERIVGHVLPLAKEKENGRWQTGPWFLRAERCYLLPGDSPLGFRLPLDSLPWVSATDYPWTHAPDPLQAFRPLPRRAVIAEQRRLGRGTVRRAFEKPGPFESASSITRTALCAEPRNGLLYIFMPPLAALEDYVELAAAVEAAAAELACPVMVEGYEPPKDPRVESMRVTPDPGVLEVNIHPAASWDDLVDSTTFLYEQARECRLGTEKFMLDGRHTGTGGGNHFVLGAPSAPDSPFLRRPDLLASLVAYWHNHPSLSYLFSGLFVGPTSQHPRIDEARNDSVYEMEIALRELERHSHTPPWLVDRLFRNLLVDATGNTHRAELCIDKLYNPDGAAGRLGLLELRGFEMPPHPRLSLTQQLLLRALVARFWREPYRAARLKRWGTEVHDRFMLPWFVWQDFEDVLAETAAAGCRLQPEWFAPHFEFRFPLYGAFSARGVHVELRGALEPWHVMGEEGALGAAVRYVDSSLERLQVRASGLIGERHVVACNGRAVPLQPTGNVGEYVAGVRYRAWQPPSALHPTVGVHAPLVFDLVDTWMHRSLGGCRYHVAHPGGRHYATFPVNAYEAEGRRRARFMHGGHTPRELRLQVEERNPSFPFTLDLRR
ncbi:MAG: transglutaminase family protein [Betaproteobacteria bacterium]